MDALLGLYRRIIQIPLVAFLIYVGKSFIHHGNSRSAFYLAFTSLFAVVPVMTVMFAILALIPELKGMESTMQNFMFEHFVPTTGTQIQNYLRGFAHQASNLTSIGVVMLFVTAVLMLRKIEKSFNTIWHVPEARKGINGFLLYWALLSLGPVMMGGAFAISSYLFSQKILHDMVPLAGFKQLAFAILPILMSGLAFSLAYIAIPNTRVPILHGIIGGMVAALLFDLARRGMTLFISEFPSYELVYGAFAAVPIFLMWVLVSWHIMLLGAEIVQAITNFKINKQRAGSSLGNLLSILDVLYRAQSQGELEDEMNLLQRMPWISTKEWESFTDTLVSVGLVHRNGEGAIGLSRDLHKYTLAQLFSDCYGASVSLDFQSEEGWQGQVMRLYRNGLDRCLKDWEIPLSSLFEGKGNPQVSLQAVAKKS